ncbi:MAG: glutamine synthetase family protein [Halioglobus sp.]
MTTPSVTGEFEAFFERHPDTQMLEVLTPDMNGIFRGRRILHSEWRSLQAGGLKASMSQALVTTTGNYRDEVDARLAGGEPDRTLVSVPGSLVPVPWLASPTAQVMAGLCDAQGRPCWSDPRQVLARVVERLRYAGLFPVVATELEFYLLAPGQATHPRALLSSVGALSGEQAGDRAAAIEDLWEHDSFISEVHAACDAQNVPLIAIQRESSAGQWEINTRHVDDPVLACDHALLLKRIVKGVAFRHGIAATFMAKPFADADGSGLHVHTSLRDAQGRNLLLGAGPADALSGMSGTLQYAVGGLLDSMPEAMAIFAPNANSYRRFVPGTCVPLSPSWGYNHRDVSVRLPVSGGDSFRLEHRVAGADANPYLVVAAVLAGMLRGIEAQQSPGPMLREASALPDQGERLPARWERALDLAAASQWLPTVLGENYCNAFLTMRRVECDAFHRQIPDIDYAWYLRAV